MRGLLFAALAAGAVSACSGTKLSQFKDAEPKLDLYQYFRGESVAYGIFEDRFGKIRRQFRVDITGSVDDGGTLVLDERFQYADGETDRRVWRINRAGPDRYRGEAGDIIGTAQGRVVGNALNWSYRMDLKVGDGTWRVGFDDWMLLQDDKVLINKATVTRFGLEIGRLFITFRKTGDTADDAMAEASPRSPGTPSPNGRRAD
ncbi:uncharacterized protein DUF3833 [Rhodothalassium salexigens DSM 2132]|uniref:Uncharacterized protein DUF3833 n=1 Tax=Rhodothalassium salexigens DSM 2132 TaxID=1188247 RepID=A0A4R2PWD6_RHOSA|nr:DUF3833 domain-containing protein [Rhodothalassium salexigens]MBB4210401.1 hypothetical protein [Rhodothalassium salexigens DSM 2132]MBK1638602.1 hypothetical protein [Rhodothalassium salexigens DSM 2132]TCP38565.1 uncharacterized protein DUF3833 [Rhodothalassium salexigens DSM 2132]